MQNQILELFKRSFPYIIRDDETVLNILSNESNKIIAKTDMQNKLIAVSVINKNSILLFCVDEEYRNQGIGTDLLRDSEEFIKSAGYDEIIIGEGFDYIMPGVPTSKRYFESVNENLHPRVDSVADDFFTKRGYEHSWDCNCFDMRFELKDFCQEEHSIGDTIEGISYRWAGMEDIKAIYDCTDDAFPEFTQWYKDEGLYDENSSHRVLIATVCDEVAGTLIVGADNEPSGLGSVGCTAVRPKFRGNHIAVNLVTLGTKYLRNIGMKEAYLSYTYSGLDKLYGYSGYKISVYYMMARKKL